MSWLQTIIDDRDPRAHRVTQKTFGSERGVDGLAPSQSSELRDTTGSPGEGLFSYHLDDLTPFFPLLRLEECFELPERQVVDILLDAYFGTVHLAFPIVFKPKFLQEYEEYMERQVQPQPIRTWLASLNVMLAIGSVYAQLTDASWKGGSNDHLVFLAKAQSLFFSNGILFHNPDQRQVQALGILGIYLLATKQINR
ncbi:hypothetical protein ABW20_dc0101189 [Dactylellina cionopaga]|nr:hypothetical protein ABW20_dc0101189 [Dactylellina cionopaga]